MQPWCFEEIGGLFESNCAEDSIGKQLLPLKNQFVGYNARRNRFYGSSQQLGSHIIIIFRRSYDDLTRCYLLNKRCHYLALTGHKQTWTFYQTFALSRALYNRWQVFPHHRFRAFDQLFARSRTPYNGD